METFVIKAPRVLIIGAVEKHSGKTTLSERIVSSFLGKPICAIKITIFRGGESEKGYSITEALIASPEKDTQRLKLAGASPVLWVRCDESHAEKAIEEAFSRLPENIPLLCESNMARNYIEPGLFIMVKRDIQESTKKTAESVSHLSDIIAVSTLNDGKLNYLPDIPLLIRWDDEKWKI